MKISWANKINLSVKNHKIDSAPAPNLHNSFAGQLQGLAMTYLEIHLFLFYFAVCYA